MKKSRLVNVRLDETHLKKARALRARGVTLSEVVREAIDAKFDALAGSQPAPDAKQLIAALFARYPDSEDRPPRPYDVHDARAARAAIRQSLSRERQ